MRDVGALHCAVVARYALAIAMLALALLPALALTPAQKRVDFSAAAPFVELGSALTAYHSAGGADSGNTRWEIMAAANQSPNPATRILTAEDPPDEILRFFPHHARPAIRQIASSDPDVVAEPAQAYGRHAFRVVIPAGRTVSLALRLTDTDASPSVAAWNEAAIAAHNRQLAVYFAAVAGLLAAALAIATGLAVMTGLPASFWAAFTLLALFLSRLAASGVFDSLGSPDIGGPYALTAMLSGLAFAAAIRLVDAIAPLKDVWRGATVWLVRVAVSIAFLSLLAFIGVPGAMLATEAIVVVGTALLTVYLVNCGRKGVQAARSASPPAVVFSLVAAAGAAAALGAFANPALPGVIGGFTAAGAVLLVLAIASENAAAAVAQNDAESEDTESAWDAIAASHQGVFDLDLENERLNLSPEAALLAGLKENELSIAHKDWLACVHAEDRDVYLQAMEDFRAHPGTAFRVEFRRAGKESREAWLELRATMLPGEISGARCLGLLADVSARMESDAGTSVRDELGRAPGRPELLAALGKLHGQSGAAVALVDIDRFKSIHASLGDEGGDKVLVAFAQRLARTFGENTPVYRVGGDSFAVVTQGDDSGIEVARAAFVGLMKRPVEVDGRDVHVAASVGLARMDDATAPEEVLKRAQSALADAKRRGGGNWRWHDPAMVPAADAVALEASLRTALRNGEMETHFQPIMRLDDGSLVAFEALLRWNHPAKGLLEPAEFIGHSEQSGLIVELGKFALEQAVQELARWQRYFPLNPPLAVSVNLSRRQLDGGEFENAVAELLGKAVVERGSLIVELTESSVSSAPDDVQRLERLKGFGVALALDDFGTGLSTLSQLKSLPFDALKIDRSFLGPRKDDAEDRSGRAVLRSIVELAHGLGLSVVAEGVETAEDADMLKDMGCDLAQGYHFSAPLPKGDILAFIARHHAGVAPGTKESSGVSGVGGKAGDVDSQLS